MLKVISQSFLGVALELSGIYVLYLFIISLNGVANILFLILSLALMAGGVFLLIWAGKSDKTVVTKMPPIKTVLTEEDSAAAQTRLAKNSALLGDWKKTNETKDRLRMLEIQAASGSDK